jgi:hypothetical protein
MFVPGGRVSVSYPARNPLNGSFPSTEKPQFKKGCTVNVAFACLGFSIMTGMTLFYRLENRRRDRIEGGRPQPGTQLQTQEKFDLAPGELQDLSDDSANVHRLPIRAIDSRSCNCPLVGPK